MNDFQTAAEKAANARSKAALGTEFAVDYVVVKDVKFYYQQVAHAWALPLLQELDQFSAGLAALYVLAHDADTVRNEIIPEIWNGSIRQKAVQFFIDKNLLAIVQCRLHGYTNDTGPHSKCQNKNKSQKRRQKNQENITKYFLPGSGLHFFFSFIKG